MGKVDKATLGKYIEIAIFVALEKSKMWEESLENSTFTKEELSILDKMELTILEKELKNPRLVQTRYVIKDTLEELEGYPPEWRMELFEKIREKFGEVGIKFTADRPVL